MIFPAGNIFLTFAFFGKLLDPPFSHLVQLNHPFRQTSHFIRTDQESIWIKKEFDLIKLPSDLSTSEPVNRNLASSELQLYFYLPCFSCSCYQRIKNQVPYFLKLCIIQPKDWTNTYSNTYLLPSICFWTFIY